MELERLRRSVLEGPVVDINGYPYFVNPLADGIPRIDPELLNEVADATIGIADLDCDLILAPEAMGIPLAAAVSMKSGIPFIIVRKRRYGLPGEIEISQRTGYSESRMFVDTVEAGERVVVIDDVIDSGNTLRATVECLRNAGIVVTEAIAVFSRHPNLEALSEELGMPTRRLLDVKVENGKLIVL